MSEASTDPSATPPCHVFVVDDEPSVGRALVRLLTSAGYAATTFGAAVDFLNAVRPDGPECLILDLHMPGVNGLELQEQLRQSDPALVVIFLSGRSDVPATAAAMKMGAADFLTKPVQDDLLLSTVDAALQRSTELWRTRSERARLRNSYTRLTPREQEVAVLVARGLLNKQIASELGTGEKTVKVHRARALSKLGVGSVAELVRLVDQLDDDAR